MLRPRLELHFVHEILNTHFIQDTVGIDKEDEQIVIPFQVLGIDLVDKFECRFLAFPLSSMGEPGDCYPRLTICNIDTLRVSIQRQRNTQILDGLEIQLVLLITIEG